MIILFDYDNDPKPFVRPCADGLSTVACVLCVHPFQNRAKKQSLFVHARAWACLQSPSCKPLHCISMPMFIVCDCSLEQITGVRLTAKWERSFFAQTQTNANSSVRTVSARVHTLPDACIVRFASNFAHPARRARPEVVTVSV